MGDRFSIVMGGSGAGKISLLTKLNRGGFRPIPESGRAIIRETMQSGGDALPWADRTAFAEGAGAGPVRLRGRTDASGHMIFHPGTKYLILCILPVPPHVATAAKTSHYNARAFLAAYWDGIFKQDTEHKQSRAVDEMGLDAPRSHAAGPAM